MKIHTKQTTLEPFVIHEGFFPRQINWGEVKITDHSGRNSTEWFINLLKKEESYKKSFREKVHFHEIIDGPDDIYEYFYDEKFYKNSFEAQPILAFCFLMKERQRSQILNKYFAVLKEKENNLFVKIQINEKIEIKIFPYGKNFLQKSKEKRNLLLKVLK